MKIVSGWMEIVLVCSDSGSREHNHDCEEPAPVMPSHLVVQSTVHSTILCAFPLPAPTVNHSHSQVDVGKHRQSSNHFRIQQTGRYSHGACGLCLQQVEKLRSVPFPFPHEPFFERDWPQLWEALIQVGLGEVVSSFRSRKQRVQAYLSRIVLLQRSKLEFGADGVRVVPLNWMESPA